MKRIYILTITTMMIMVALFHGGFILYNQHAKNDGIKVGFLYIGDQCNAYTYNFIRAQKAIEVKYGEDVETIAKYNVPEGKEEIFLQELVDEGCDLIFSTSYGYEKATKEIAAKYPNVEFCMATGDQANKDPVLPNYHNYMGEIYQGRYLSGVVAGMKLQELIRNGKISKKDAWVGYVGAFPYAEVISGYTSFLLGVRSVVPYAKMKVIYTYSWADYEVERKVAERLIDEGCVIISQHSDTTGSASACEAASQERIVFHVGYNQGMTDIAPTTSLISSRVDWKYYMLEATEAVLKGRKIESVVHGNVHGNDVSGGYKEGWIKLLSLNETIVAQGTAEHIEKVKEKLIKGEITVFKGDYIGVNPYDETDCISLEDGYKENKHGSAPSFHYVLQDVIEILEMDVS